NEFVSHAKIESKGDSKAQLSDPIVEDLNAATNNSSANNAKQISKQFKSRNGNDFNSIKRNLKPQFINNSESNSLSVFFELEEANMNLLGVKAFENSFLLPKDTLV